MRVVQIVRRADRNIVDLFAAATHLVDVPVEPLEFGKEMRIRKIAVDDADGIVRIEGDLQIAANGLDRLHVARRDVAGGADQRKARHHLSPSPMSSDFRFTKATALRVKSPHPATFDIQVA